MKVTLLTTAPGDLAKYFAQRHAAELGEQGITLALILVDTQDYKNRHFLRHALNVARRQGRISECATITSLLRIIVWKVINRLTAERNDQTETDPPPAISVREVPSLNSDAAASILRNENCDLICLMGTRVLTPRTLKSLDSNIINIHSSDPGFVRGGPVVVWEVLAGKMEITLTVHRVIPELDSGEILLQTSQPILYEKGLGLTVQRTMYAAREKVALLFKDVILGIHSGQIAASQFVPGPLRVTPSILQTLRAEIACRKRAMKQ